MAKPVPKENHGQAVKTFVQEAQAARVDGAHPGIGSQVSEFARQNGEPQPVDFEDGVITVVKDEEGGVTQSFATFAEALAYADDGDTLQVGAGTYAEAIDLDERVFIVAEEGAVLDGSTIATDAGTTSTIELFDGFSGGSISGLEVVAVEGGNALVSIIGEVVEGVSLTGNTFDAGANTLGSVVYLNPGADTLVFNENTFEGALLTGSPLLGVEGDNVQVTDNEFGETPQTYPKVEVFNGADGMTSDVVLTGNTGLDDNDVFWA